MALSLDFLKEFLPNADVSHSKQYFQDANVLSTICFVLATGFLLGRQKGVFAFSGFPRSVFILDFLLSFCFIAGIRFVNRLARERFRPEPNIRSKKALVNLLKLFNIFRNTPKKSFKMLKMIIHYNV